MSHPEAGSNLDWDQEAGDLPPPPGTNAEAGQGRPESNFRGLSGVQKWEKEDWMKKGVLVLILRGVTLLFSFLAFMLMVTWDFHYYQAFSYVFTISLFVIVYTAVLIGINGHQIRTGQEVIKPEVAFWIEFFGDQILALLLLSSATAGAAIMPYGLAAGSVAMSFLAFISLEAAALISGYNFSIHISKVY